MYTLLLSIGVIVILFSLALSIIALRRTQNKVLDKGIDVTTRNPVMANPIYILYILFPILILIGVGLWMYYLP